MHATSAFFSLYALTPTKQYLNIFAKNSFAITVENALLYYEVKLIQIYKMKKVSYFS